MSEERQDQFLPGEAERMDTTAQSLGIPSILRDNQTTIDYLRVHVALDDFQTTLRSATINAGFAEVFTPEQRPQNQLQPSINPSLTDRYTRAGNLISVALAMTEEGLHARDIDSNFIRQNLDAALAPYGLYIADLPSDHDVNPYTEYYDPTTGYHERLSQYSIDYPERTKETEKRYMESSVMFYGNQPAPYYAHLPYMREFASVLHTFPVVQERLRQIGEHTPVQEGNDLNEDMLQREYIDEVLDAAEMILWEHAGRNFSPEKIIRGLNYALDKYSLHVDVKPYTPPILERAPADRTATVEFNEEEERYWEEVGRNFQIDSTAEAYGVPEENWQRPMVRHFLETIHNTRTLQGNLSALSSRNSEVLQVWNTGSYEEILDAFPGLPLSQRAYSAELIMRGVCEIIDSGFQGSITHPDYLVSKVGAGLGAYGLEVEIIPSETEETTIPYPEPATGIWQSTSQIKKREQDVFNRYYHGYGRENYDRYSSGLPNRNDRNRQQRIDETGARLGINPEYLKDSVMRTFLDYLNDAYALQTMYEQGEFDFAPGITPSITDRYRQCAAMMQVVIQILEFGFQGRELNQPEMQRLMNEGLMPYGVRVVLNPKYIDPDQQLDVQERLKQWKQQEENNGENK